MNLTSISLSGSYPTEFNTGDTFSHEGMTVTATYSDASTNDVTSKATFSGYNMFTTGVQTVTVSYTEGSVTKTANYDITVTERPAFSVTLGDDNTILTEESAGAGVELPTRSRIGDYDFAGWSTTDVKVETSDSPTIIPAGAYSPSSNIKLYPVYTRSEVTGEAVETKTQILAYDTWTYKAETYDKGSYRLFGNGGYVESAAFDLSTLSKVIVYGGTFGGSSYNQLEIGDGTNVWMSVTVSGNDQTKAHEYTSEGANPLTGTGKLRVTSKSGDGTDNKGVRMSKIEIFTMETPMTSYYTSHPSSKETPTWTFTPSALGTLYVGEPDATFTVTTNYDGTLTVRSSNDAIATITKTGNKTFSVHAVAKGDVVFTISGDETENYKAVSKTIAASVLQKYAVTIETPKNGTLVLKNGEVAVATGDKFLPGTVLTAEVTPAEDYNFRNWQAVDEETHTYTATFSYIMTEHDVTFKANFDAKVCHTVSWSVNGVVVSSNAKTEEGSAIAFGAPEASAIPEGYTFMGWSATEILTPQATAPTYVTEATMGDADVTYYAVLAVDSSTPVVEHTSTFTIKQASAPNSPFESEDVNWTWSNVTFENGANSCIKANGSVSLNLPSGGKAKTLKITKTSNQWAGAAEVVLKDASDNSLYTFSLGSESSATYNFTSTDNQSSSYTLSNTTAKNAWTDNIQFVYETGGESFSGYCTTIPPSELTITLNDACHDDGGRVYGTYSSSLPFVVSDDIVVSEISIVNDAFHVEAYKTGDVVPANTGVMVSAPKGGNYTVNVAPTAGASVLDAANCLRPTGDNGITAEAMGADDPGCLFYRLTMHNGTQIGYWWGAENGAAFAIAPNKAYMAIPEAEAARMMGNGFSEIFTGIVSTEQQRESVATYNLLGQRVSPDTKGVLIRNGKKLINK